MNHTDSYMLYIHPPLSIVGYMLVFASIISIMLEKKRDKDFGYITVKILYLMWLFNFAGLATGMIWAQMAWGSYWSWDPKESITLLIFILTSLAALLYEKNSQISILLLSISSIFIFLNILISFSNFSIHGYGIFFINFA